MKIDSEKSPKYWSEQMVNESSQISSRTIWLSMFLFWTLIAATFPITDYIKSMAYPEKEFNLLGSFAESAIGFYLWFALTPLIFWFGRKFGFGRNKKWALNLAIHLVLSYLVVSAYLLLVSAIVVCLLHGKYEFSYLWLRFFDRFYMVGHYQVIIYWAILGAGVSFDYYKKYREREIEASRLLLRSTTLESQLSKAQLDSLKMQLHPHFLFNTLHAISALMEDSPKRARRMIARLGELLRSTLDISDQQTITVEKEIALTRLYLEIEQERFREDLEVKIDVGSDELECAVPSLILQPLVENAIKHGIKNQKKAVIEVAVVLRNKRIEIRVKDNGPGFSFGDSDELEEGIGLSNTKARLEQLYGDKHEFSVTNSDEGGAVVEISFPCKVGRDNEAKR